MNFVFMSPKLRKLKASQRKAEKDLARAQKLHAKYQRALNKQLEKKDRLRRAEELVTSIKDRAQAFRAEAMAAQRETRRLKGLA